MLASELNVVRDEEFATHRQVIILTAGTNLMEALSAINTECSVGKFTGSVTLNYNEGGVTNITTHHVKRDLIGLFDEDEKGPE